MCPIVGTRYHLPGQDYDLCQAEWDKLPPQEQATYERIERPRDAEVSIAFDKRVLLLVLLALYLSVEFSLPYSSAGFAIVTIPHKCRCLRASMAYKRLSARPGRGLKYGATETDAKIK